MGFLWADLRYALRGFGRSPLFTLVAVASLALGLGANTAIFNLLDQVILRPLPVKEPKQLVLLETPGPKMGFTSGESQPRMWSNVSYRMLAANAPVFDGLAAHMGWGLSLSYKGRADYVTGDVVSGNFFETLGVKPALGRLFTAEDDQHRAGHPVVVLSYGYWTRRFGADPAILGQGVRINSTPMTVIGVAPKGFFGIDVGRATDVYVPLMMKAQATIWDMLDRHDAFYLHLIGRLKPGMSLTQAQAALQPLLRATLEENLRNMRGTDRFRALYAKKPMVLRPAAGGIPAFRDDQSAPVEVMMAMVGLVLLIACANVANLLLARAMGRQKEIAIRLSMGASRGQLIRQFLVESVTLALLGAVVGMVVATWTSDLLLRAIPSGAEPTALTSALDPRAVIFCFVLSIVTGVLFGVVPALQASRPVVNSVLKSQAAGIVGGFGQIRSRQALVAAQVALSLLLLIGAGLFTRSLMNLRSVDPGFQAGNMAMFTIDASRTGYAPARVQQTYETIQDRLHMIGGVQSVSASDTVLLSGNSSSMTVHVEGYEPKHDENMNPMFQRVMPEYFETMKIPLLDGREFSRQDRLGGRKVAVVNETFARRYFAGQSALGRHFGLGPTTNPADIEIVGVARDGKYTNLKKEQMTMVYMPIAQDDGPGEMSFAVRTQGKPEMVLPEIRRMVAQVDPGMALWDVTTMELRVEQSLFAERMIAGLCACFGLLATILAAVGLYGVMSYSVTRRTREIGIRVALGAGQTTVLRVVLQEVTILCLVGVVAGLPISAALSRYVESQLYGVRPADPAVMAGAAAFLLLVSLLAGFLPARRAANIDPMVALRYE